MKVIVIGCGTFGKELSYKLFLRGHEVVVVDHTYAAFNSLPPDFKGRLVEGEVLNQEVLHRAGVEQADVLITATGSDVLNLAVGHVAQEHYHVPTVIARNYEPALRSLYEIFGLQVVSGSSWAIRRIEDFLHHNGVRTVFSAGNGDVEIYEITIPAHWNGHRLGDLVENHAVPAAVTRSGRAFIPTADSLLEENDVVHISATFDGIDAIRAKMASAEVTK